jgi:hypothetical protein
VTYRSASRTWRCSSGHWVKAYLLLLGLGAPFRLRAVHVAVKRVLLALIERFLHAALVRRALALHAVVAHSRV